MNKFKLVVTAVLASTTMALVSCGEPQAKITSFTIQEVASQTLKLGHKLTLTCIISSDKEADNINEVEWSIDNSDVATIAPNGKKCVLEGKKEGTVKVTVTSKFDNSKSASIQIEIVKPNWLESNVAKMKELFGEQVPYFGEDWYDEEYECFYASTDNGLENALDLLEDSGYRVAFAGYYEDAFPEYYGDKPINDTKRIALDLTEYGDEYASYGYSGSDCYMYLEEAVTEWPTEETTFKYMDFEAEALPKFAAASFYVYADTGYCSVEAYKPQVNAQQLSEVYKGKSWTVEYDKEEEFYTAYSPKSTVEVNFYDDGDYLSVNAEQVAPELDKYPAAYVNKFVETQTKSYFQVPEIKNGLKYFYLEGLQQDYYGDEFMCATLEVDCEKSTYNDFVADLRNAHFNVEEEDGSLYATAGKLCVESYYSDNSLVVYLYADETADNVPFYLNFYSYTLLMSEKSEQIIPTALEGHEGTFKFSVKDSTVVTVDDAGHITPVKEGSTVVTVELTTTADSKKYSMDVPVSIVPKATGVELYAPTKVYAGKTVELDVYAVPEGSKIADEAVYSIIDGAEYATITPSGVLTVSDKLTESHEFIVKVVCGALSDTATIVASIPGEDFKDFSILITEAIKAQGGSEVISLPDISGSEYEFGDDEEYGIYMAVYDNEVSPEEYAATLEAKGWTIEIEPDYGNPIATSPQGAVSLDIYEQNLFGYVWLEIDVYLN